MNRLNNLVDLVELSQRIAVLFLLDFQAKTIGGEREKRLNLV